MKLYDIPNIQKLAKLYASLNDDNPFESSQASGITQAVEIIMNGDYTPSVQYNLKQELEKLSKT